MAEHAVTGLSATPTIPGAILAEGEVTAETDADDGDVEPVGTGDSDNDDGRAGPGPRLGRPKAWRSAPRRPVILALVLALAVPTAIRLGNIDDADALISRYKRTDKIFPGFNGSGISLRTRGYIDDSCITYVVLACFTASLPLQPRAEITAQSLAMNFLAVHRGLDAVDWEVGPGPDTPRGLASMGGSIAGEDETDPCTADQPGYVKDPNHWRIDIVVDQRTIIEVKSFKGSATKDEVTNQLNCYTSYALNRPGGVEFRRNGELNAVSWAVPFLFPTVTGDVVYCTWAPPDPLSFGHIYFAPLDQAEPDAKAKCALPLLKALVAAGGALAITRQQLLRRTPPVPEPVYRKVFTERPAFTVSVLQDPDVPRSLQFHFGDSTGMAATVPAGTDVSTFTFTNTVPFRTGRYVQRVTVTDVPRSIAVNVVPQETELSLPAESVTDVEIC